MTLLKDFKAETFPLISESAIRGWVGIVTKYSVFKAGANVTHAPSSLFFKGLAGETEMDFYASQPDMKRIVERLIRHRKGKGLL